MVLLCVSVRPCPHMCDREVGGRVAGLWLWELVCLSLARSPLQGQMPLFGGERRWSRSSAKGLGWEHHPSWRGPCWLAAWRLVSKARTPVAMGTQA